MTKISVQKKVNVTRIVKVSLPIEQVKAILSDAVDIIPDDIPADALNIGFAGEPGERVLVLSWEEVE